MNSFELKTSWQVATQFSSVAISPNGKLLVTGGLKIPTIEVWNTNTGEIVNSWLASPPLANPNVTDPINAMDISSDSRLLVTGGQLQTWKLSTYKRKKKFRGFGGRVSAAKFSPNCNLLLTGGGVGTTPVIFVWDLSENKKLFTLKDCNNHSFCISSDSKFLAEIDSVKESIKLWSLLTGEIVKIIETKNSSIRVRTFTFDSEGKILIGGGFDGIRIWNIETEAQIQLIDKFKNIKLHQHLDNIHCIEILSDNKTIITAGEDGNIQLWNINTGNHIETIKGKNRVSNIVLSSNKKVLAGYSNFDRSVNIWSLN